MPSTTLTLSPIYPIGTLTLQSEESSARVVIETPTPALVLALTPIVGVGGSGVSGPDIYAFAADQG